MPDVPVTFLPRDKDVRKGYADAMRGNPPSKKVPMTGMASGRTDRGMRKGSAFKTPDVTPVDDYMGMAFDAAVRKGKDAARAYLLEKMKRDGRTEGFIQGKLAAFDTSIGTQKSLQKNQGLAEDLQNIYRKQPGISYKDALEERNKESFKKMVRPLTNAANAVNKMIVGPKPSQMGTDRYYGEGGI
jgi:hypothetical protein